MSLRVRKDGTILCAAKHPPMGGDVYIDDGVHYLLAVLARVVIPEDDEDATGRWRWVTESPKLKGRADRS
jgi:hypothetical protein